MIFKQKGLIRIVLIFVMGSSIFGLIILWLMNSTPASALPSDLTTAETKYEVIFQTRIDSCAFCHLGDTFVLNPYGEAYQSLGRSDAALTAIEGVDSDGDGFTNIQEINALTFPGDPNDHPSVSTATPTTTPTTTTTPTVTETATETETATVTATATATEAVLATATLGPSTTPVSKPLKVYVPLVSH